MLYKKTLRLLLLVALASAAAVAQQQSAKQNVVDAERLRAHVNYLASDKLEGRRTGEPGALEAANYISGEFERYGLKPGGINVLVFNGTRATKEDVFFQPFPFVAAVELGKGNELEVTRRVVAPAQGTPLAIDLRVGDDWMPLGFSSNASVENAPVVFVGYGITAADQNYDDYKDTDVKDKIALALSGTPDGDNPHGKFTRAGELRFKAAAARAAGAKALVIVASEENFKDERLTHLRYDNAGGDAGLPVVVISRQATARMVRFGGTPQTPSDFEATLAEFEKKFREQKSGTVEKYRDEYLFMPFFLEGAALSITTDVVRKDAPAWNVVGVLEGTDPVLKNEVIVIGAHYDHLGRGGEGSLAAREGDIHHGADDNASGTAGLLELARLLSQDKSRMRRTVVFIAFSGEEEGLIGSSFYVNAPARPLAETVAMINMDMIGRLKDDVLNVGGVGTAAEWRGWVEEANKGFRVSADPMGKSAPPAPAADNVSAAQKAGSEPPIVVTGSNGRVVAVATPVERFALRMNEDGFGPSDHSSFYAKRVPVLFFFTGSHEDYHKPTDTADKINYDGEARVLEFVREIVYDLQASDKRPTYAVAKSEANSRSTGFRVYLGTIPSYADSTDGLKLDGVREGSPAAAAGLKAGDKVVKLAGRDIRNVYDYTQALSEMKAGQEYEVEVVRDGQRLTLKITPAARK